MTEKGIMRSMIADHNKQHPKGNYNHIETSKKSVARKMSSHDAVRAWKETGKKPKGLHKVDVSRYYREDGAMTDYAKKSGSQLVKKYK